MKEKYKCKYCNTLFNDRHLAVYCAKIHEHNHCVDNNHQDVKYVFTTQAHTGLVYKQCKCGEVFESRTVKDGNENGELKQIFEILKMKDENLQS